jgi:hypothetical protein
LALGTDAIQLDPCYRLIFRDLLASLMCAPGLFKNTMRPTRSFREKIVRDPADKSKVVSIAFAHDELWWSTPDPARWPRLVRDYMDPSRFAKHRHYVNTGRADVAAAQAAAEAKADANSRSKSLANYRRWEAERAKVSHFLPPRPPATPPVRAHSAVFPAPHMCRPCCAVSAARASAHD